MANLSAQNLAEGPAYVLIGKSAYDVAPDVPPADANTLIANGGTWGGAWYNLGVTTDAGLQIAGLSPATTPLMVAQQRGAFATAKGSSAQTVSFTMLEFSALNLQYILGQGTITSTGTHDNLTLSDDPIKYFALGLEVFGPLGKPLRYFFPVTTGEMTGNIDHRIGQYANIPVRFTRSGGVAANPQLIFVK